MLYGVKDDDTLLLVAADATKELDAFVENAPPFLDMKEIDLFTLMSDDRYKGLSRAYTCLADGVEFTEISMVRAAEVQRNMLFDDQEDIYAKDSSEERTIAEIYGLDKYDPFDPRDEETKENDADKQKRRDELAAAEEEYRKKKLAGEISDGSFSPKKNVGVTDIRGIINRETDEITITDVIAQKGLWVESTAEEEESETRIKSTAFKVFYRLDVHGATEASFDELFAKMPNIELNKIIVDRGTFDEDGSSGVWTASGLLRLAEKTEDAVKALDPSLATEVYAVNRDNERLVPKGTLVVDTLAEREIGPRPWNDRAAEWYAWSDEERAEEVKTNIRGDEFIFAGSGSEITRSTMVYIVPKVYFEKNNGLWTETLPIAHLLPEGIKEIEPGVYEDRNRGWLLVLQNLGKANMYESMMLRLYLNGL